MTVRRGLCGIVAILMLAPGCVSRRPTPADSDVSDVRQAIQDRYAHQASAYQRRDADAFLDNLEPDFTAVPRQGPVSTKEQAAAAIRRRIMTVESPSIRVVIDSLRVLRDTAEVYNTQQFLRVVRDSTGAPFQVRSTQQHFERWRRTPRGWRIYFLRELGGSQEVLPMPGQMR